MKIQDIRRRSKAINYSSTSIDAEGNLIERASLLDQRIVEGYGCIWGKPNSYGEIVHRGAYLKSIQEHGPGSNSSYQIKFRDEHNRSCGLFDILREDETGLYFRTVPLDDVSWANDMIVQLRSGTINNFSVGFQYVWDKIDVDEDKGIINIREAILYEISGVSVPADMNTYAIRSISRDDVNDKIEDLLSLMPKKEKLRARHILAELQSLIEDEPPAALIQKEPVQAIDYNYLINNFKI